MNFSFKLIVAVAAIVFSSSASCLHPRNSYILSLNSDNQDGEWVVHNSNNSIKTSAIVPGGIYTDLMRNKIIDNILYQDNDVETRWIAKDRWIYSRNFTVTSEILEKNTVNLVFYGLDTIASIILNKHSIGSTDNMFSKHVFDVKKNLVEGHNLLLVYFTSPVVVADSRSEQEMIPPECIPSIYNGECSANQLRKMQASFAWDWGPGFPSMGIWKPVNIEAYDSAVITDITTSLALNSSDSNWYLSLKVYLEAPDNVKELEGYILATLETNNNSSVTTYDFIKKKIVNKNRIETDMSITVNVGQVSTWWPNGYGEQRLYKLDVSFQSVKYPNELFHKDIKVGFRTIELIQDEISTSPGEDGLTFYFKVNDKPIFMKGTNWIPLDILPEAGYDKDRVDYLLMSAKNVNMNMMRVWGGGVYESDYFYEKCDELGILIWQDFMFACSMYPANDKYLSSVATEVEQVVRRLQHHASIALWAGNNENELALRDNWYGTGHNFSHYKSEYIKLYVDTMRPVVVENDPTRDYLVSSPSNGKKSEDEGFIAEKPGDPHYGDTHYYNYIEDMWSMDTYPKTRFSSEYGFQAIPSLDTLRTATNNLNDLKIDSEFMIHRQHSPSGYTSIINQIEKHLILPEPDHPDYFSVLVYLSQVNQAMAIKVETEFYRQSRHDWMTMGALYWQLNDVWQAPSWSSIEHGGRWKILHYFANQFFSSVLISPRLYLTNEIGIFLINDQLEPLIDATITIDTFKWDDLTPISTSNSQIDITGLGIVKIDSNISLPAKNARGEIFYRFSLKNDKSELISPYNYIFPVALKDIVGYKNPEINAQITEKLSGDDGLHVYKVSVETDGHALFVWLEIPYSIGWFSDNGFILTEATKEIILTTREPLAQKDFNQIIKIRTVFDSNSKYM